MNGNKLYHRRSIRLPGYDYSAPGEYFITIVTYQREPLFGKIQTGEMELSLAGRIVADEWFKTAKLRPYVELCEGEFVVMPNHFHAIIHILEEDGFVQPAIPSSPRRGDRPVAPTNARGPSPRSVGAIMAGFKSVVTKRINTLRQTPGMPVWQRNYYEHIIETEKEYLTIEAYIENNPANWMKDLLYPSQMENGDRP